MELDEFTPSRVRPTELETAKGDGTANSEQKQNFPVLNVENGYGGGNQEESDLLDKLFQENHELKVKLSKISHDYELMRDAKVQLEADTAQLLRAKEAEHVERLGSLRAENYNLKSYLDEYEQRQKDLEAKLLDAQGRTRLSAAGGLGLGLTTAQVDELKESHTKEIKMAQERQAGQIRMLGSKVKSLESELQAAKTRSSGAKLRLEQLTKAKGELEDELTQHKRYKTEVDGLRSRLALLQDRLDQESERATASEFQNQALKERLESEQERVRNLQEDKNSLQQKLQLTGLHDEYEEDSDHSYSFGSLNMDGNEVGRLQSQNTSLQAKLDQRSLAAEMDEANAVIIQELRSREAELVSQLCEKEAEIERMKSVEIFGTSYAAVFRRQSEVVEVVQTLDPPPDSHRHPSPFSGPLLDLDPEMHSGDFASVTSMSFTAESDDEGNQKHEGDFPGQNTEEYARDFDLIDETGPGTPDQLTPRPQTDTGSSSSASTAFNLPLLSTPTPTPPPQLGIHASAHDYEAQIQKIHAAYEMEERLLASAFYNYSLELHRNAATSKNTPTWLERQRSAAARNADYDYDFGYEYEKHESVKMSQSRAQAQTPATHGFFPRPAPSASTFSQRQRPNPSLPSARSQSTRQAFTWL